MATIRKKSAGTYQLIVYTRYTEDGKQKRIYRTWTAPEGLTPKAAEKAAQRAADDLETQILHGQDPKRIRMDAFARKWLDEYAEPNLAPKTVSGYRDMMPRVVNAFGCLYLDEIGSKNLSNFYADLRKTPCATHYCSDGGLSALMESQGVSKTKLCRIANVSDQVVTSATHGQNISKRSAKKIADALKVSLNKIFHPCKETSYLSGTTALHYHRMISSMLTTAVYWNYLQDNPAKRTRSPRKEKTKPKYLEPEEAIAWLERMDEQRVPPKYRTATCIGLFAGTRKEETFGLKWGDINFEKCTMNIERTAIYVRGKGLVIGDTKNDSSCRVIAIPVSLAQILQEFRNYKIVEFGKVGVEVKQDDFIFAEVDGHLLHPDTFGSWMRRFHSLNPDLKDIPPHGLRHTNASIMINNGIPLTAVSGRLGHADTATTTRVYSHMIQSAQAAAAEKIQDIFSGYRRH